MGFDDLHPIVQHHVVNSLGWTSLRALQESAVAPLLAGTDALLLAPTAGGKTEAAALPLLSRMENERWAGLSLLYVCPLRALLDDLAPRLAAYASWIGRRCTVWHGDTSDSTRRGTLAEPPDVLLTTPESLEAMLVSTRVRPRDLFSELRAVVVDEVHAFAGDDRGWHLLAVLERLQRLADRPLQRIGLSATVGNPDDLVQWLQGSNTDRERTVISPDASGTPGFSGQSGNEGAGEGGHEVDVRLDYVGSLPNAATVIAGLHHGEKRLVFCDSKRRVEELAVELRARNVDCFVSHAGLSTAERRRTEAAFHDAHNCVIVATSTLELGIDIGDLDRVIQIDAPRTVAAFLQRLGRTGRRPGSLRNTLFLATSRSALLTAAGLLLAWSEGWVEPVTAPPAPRHLIAQQLLALCLQEGRIGSAIWLDCWGKLPLFDESSPEIVRWMVESGRLEADDGMLFIGPESERRYGRRHFMELLSTFAGEPLFHVLHGRDELGTVDPMLLVTADNDSGPRMITLAGRVWVVGPIDWRRRRCWVEPAPEAAAPSRSSQPAGFGSIPLSFELTQARRAVLVGHNPPVSLTRRAVDALAELREDWFIRVAPNASVVTDASETFGASPDGTGTGTRPRWWTWAGMRANATLAVNLPDVLEGQMRFDNDAVALRPGVSVEALSEAIEALDISAGLAAPEVSDQAIRGLKFADALPPQIARETLAIRLTDEPGARTVLQRPLRSVRSNPQE